MACDFNNQYQKSINLTSHEISCVCSAYQKQPLTLTLTLTHFFFPSMGSRFFFKEKTTWSKKIALKKKKIL